MARDVGGTGSKVSKTQISKVIRARGRIVKTSVSTPKRKRVICVYNKTIKLCDPSLRDELVQTYKEAELEMCRQYKMNTRDVQHYREYLNIQLINKLKYAANKQAGKIFQRAFESIVADYTELPIRSRSVSRESDRTFKLSDPNNFYDAEYDTSPTTSEEGVSEFDQALEKLRKINLKPFVELAPLKYRKRKLPFLSVDVPAYGLTPIEINNTAVLCQENLFSKYLRKATNTSEVTNGVFPNDKKICQLTMNMDVAKDRYDFLERYLKPVGLLDPVNCNIIFHIFDKCLTSVAEALYGCIYLDHCLAVKLGITEFDLNVVFANTNEQDRRNSELPRLIRTVIAEERLKHFKESIIITKFKVVFKWISAPVKIEVFDEFYMEAVTSHQYKCEPSMLHYVVSDVLERYTKLKNPWQLSRKASIFPGCFLPLSGLSKLSLFYMHKEQHRNV